MTNELSERHQQQVTGGWNTQSDLDSLDETRSSLTNKSSHLRRRVKALSEDSKELHRAAIRSVLAARGQKFARQGTSDLLRLLRSWGFAWTDVARIVGVSVPALQKWRKGTSPSGENRLRLALLVALVDYLEHELLVNEPASWLEMPIREGVQATALDLLSQQRESLVIELASHQTTPEKVLDEFEPDWRNVLIDYTFEVFTASDGSKAIRPRV